MAINRIDSTFTDAYGISIHYHRWAPKGESKAVIQIVHGLGEHALRYRYLAERLVAQGYEVWADELRGHGPTGLEQWNGDFSKLGKLGPGGVRAAISAVRQFSGIIRKERPGKQLIIVGHSLGAIFAQMILNIGGSRDYDRVVLTGAALRLPGFMNAGNLNSRHRHLGAIGAEWLSRDLEVQEAWRDDPLTFVANTLRLFGIVDSARLLGIPRRLDYYPPILILIGSDDSLGGKRSVTRLKKAFLAKGSHDVTMRIYDDARHEVFNEINRDEVIDDLLRWLSTGTLGRRL